MRSAVGASVVLAALLVAAAPAAAADPPARRTLATPARSAAPAPSRMRLLRPATLPPPTRTPPPASPAREHAHYSFHDIAHQAHGILFGMGEKILGRYASDTTEPFHPIEVKPPNNATRSVVVFRSNHPKTVEDIGHIVELAKQRGVTDASQIKIINLRSEHDEDRNLVARYEATSPALGGGRIRTTDVKILDSSPPAFYIGSLGWNRAVDKVRQVYTALKDPTTKVAVIHCKAGRGRTGEMVATAVRVAMDRMPAREAVAEAKRRGLTEPWQQAFIERFAREWEAGTIHFD